LIPFNKYVLNVYLPERLGTTKTSKTYSPCLKKPSFTESTGQCGSSQNTLTPLSFVKVLSLNSCYGLDLKCPPKAHGMVLKEIKLPACVQEMSLGSVGLSVSRDLVGPDDREVLQYFKAGI
jgi:hypothetical protein